MPLAIITVTLMMMMSVGFMTLLERKLMSLIQMRLGPNKTLLSGIIQPILDGFKLIKKENSTLKHSTAWVYEASCLWLMVVSMLLWYSLPISMWASKPMTLLWMVLCTGLTSFSFLLAGWSSTSKYSFVGSMRSVAQIISYEVSFMLIMALPMMMKNTLKMDSTQFQTILPFLTPLILILLMTESQRSPFDLSEGESELVSGYNTEYGAIKFTMIFLSEYIALIAMSMVMLIMTLKMNTLTLAMTLLTILTIRCSFPRIRYDMLMSMYWYVMLPLSALMWLILAPLQ